jgi:hypothetical protein
LFKQRGLKEMADTAAQRRLDRKIASLKASMELPNLSAGELEILRSNLAKLLRGDGLLGHFRN